MFIGKKDKEGNIYYTFSDLPKIHILTEVFKYGFYVSMVIWFCEFVFQHFMMDQQ